MTPASPAKKPISSEPPGARARPNSSRIWGSSAGGAWITEYQAKTPPRDREANGSADRSAVRNRLPGKRSRAEIGRASCRERVGQYVESSVVAVSLKNKK